MSPGEKELITSQLNAYLGIRCGVHLDREVGICLVDPESGEVVPPGSERYSYMLEILKEACPA